MKKTRLKKIATVLVILLVINEFTPINFRLYKSYSNMNTSSSSTSSTYKTKILSNKIKNSQEVPTISNSHKKNHIISFKYEKEKTNTSENNKNKIIAYIDKNISISNLRFIPLIKHITYSSNNTYSWDTKIYITGQTIHIEGTSSISINGHKNIYGLYSGKEAEQLINKVIITEIEKGIRKDIEIKIADLYNKAN